LRGGRDNEEETDAMALAIRLTRTGTTNDVSYRVVATDSRHPRDGRHLELLGWYDPKRKGTNFSLKQDRIEHWVARGAQVSRTVTSLLRQARRAARTQANA
jgi:small subunit ribosomal protein S16